MVAETSSSVGPKATEEIKYKTSFGKCPSRTAGTMALKIVKNFEQTRSLKSVKNEIIKDKVDEKHFVSGYKVSYDPYQNYLKLSFDCPEPLMKVQVYKDSGVESYEAILVDSGELYDPTYEVLLRTEHKLTRDLPYLAIPVGEMDKTLQTEITDLLRGMEPEFRQKLAEIILGDKGDLTVILSVSGQPSSVFLGKKDWNEKIEKLNRIVNYMESRKRIPAIINLTNAKKVVVKFNDKI
jgi:hypothetical protein